MVDLLIDATWSRVSDIVDVEDEDFLQMGMLKLEIKRIRRKADEQSKGMQVQNPVAGMQQQPVVAMAQPVMVAAPQPQTMQVQAPQRRGNPAPEYGDCASCCFCCFCGGCCGICGICAWCTSRPPQKLRNPKAAGGRGREKWARNSPLKECGGRRPILVWTGNECEVRDLNRAGDYDLARIKAAKASQCRNIGVVVTMIFLALILYLEMKGPSRWRQYDRRTDYEYYG